ncbi:hypothetical protein [Brevibacillus sp. SYSU BS000544]|uniref:hypothetical protein n=1 Tax=Brevibacillus sp. SYSU BS000544 TaxID=3416443 RepID=UPI003CE5A343
MSDSFHLFKRMNYFPGQLLTARNFEDEQIYMNEKRQLINRLKFGEGIVTGLEVQKEDSKLIRITPGVALDSLGREIVVDVQKIKPISVGHPNEKCWVCLKLDPKPIDPVPPTDHSCSNQESCNYNRIQEYFRLRISFSGPEAEEVVLASIQLDSQGDIGSISPTPSQKVFTNELYEMILNMEERIDALEQRLRATFESGETSTND